MAIWLTMITITVAYLLSPVLCRNCILNTAHGSNECFHVLIIPYEARQRGQFQFGKGIYCMIVQSEFFPSYLKNLYGSHMYSFTGIDVNTLKQKWDMDKSRVRKRKQNRGEEKEREREIESYCCMCLEVMHICPLPNSFIVFHPILFPLALWHFLNTP